MPRCSPLRSEARNRDFRSGQRNLWSGLLVVLFFTALLQPACDALAPGSPATARPSLEPQIREHPVRIDLAADLPLAWLDREIALVDLADRDEQRRFTHGWYRISKPKRGESHIWSNGRYSVVELPVVRPRDFRLELEVSPLDAPERLPQQSLRLVWNGHDLGLHSLAWKRQTLAVDVPAGIQRLGINRLELLPLYWVSPASVQISLNTRPVGVKLHALRLDGLALEAALVGPPARLEEGVVVQRPKSLVSWHYVLPKQPRLRAEVSWRGAVPVGESRWTLSLSDRDDNQLTLASVSAAELAERGTMTIDVDLSAHADEMVGIESTLTATDSTDAEADAAVELRSLRIEGVRHERVVDLRSVRDRYHVLVILFDALRADHLAPYGNQEVLTPSVTRLAERGFTFENAYANASWTRPSVASLWTGLYPTAHRVVSPHSRLPAAAPFLPMLLRETGYHTIAVSNNAHFSRNFGFDRGFDRMVEYFTQRSEIQEKLPSPEAQAEHVWTKYLAPAFSSPGGKPVFAVVHEIDPHAPNQPPPPYDALYDTGYQGNMDGWNTGDFREGMRMLKVINDLGPWLGEADRREMRARYAGEVSFIDAYLGWLIDKLEQEGLQERTLVVFLSDHGEQFFEHGSWGHGRSLYQEELSVPLIFSLPGVLPEGGRSRATAQLVDVTPTLLDLLGVDTPKMLQGRSLLPEMFAVASNPAPRTTFARSNTIIFGKGTVLQNAEEWHSVRHGDWKLMRHTFKRAGYSFYEYDLYDLSRDPDEVLDRWGSELVVGLTLEQMLESRIARDAHMDLEASASSEIDPQVLDNLRELGYVE